MELLDKKIYKGKREVECLEKETYQGYEYIILSLGSHPCCYVVIPQGHRLHGIGYDGNEEMQDISVHGGLTYASNDLGKIEVPKDSWIIGWDYAHYNDYQEYDLPGTMSLDCFGNGKKWTMKELRTECKNVIEQIIAKD